MILKDIATAIKLSKEILIMKDYKLIGTVCEYNPFHYGHKYNLDKAKRHFNADYTVCVMSGSFVQRGDVAIYDKWSRAECAVKYGADLVLELPVYYTMQSAKNFCFGGVKVLNSVGADFLTFGSECGDIDFLKSVADVIKCEPEPFKETLKEELKKGVGYPSAIQKAIKGTLGCDYTLSPNDSLAVNYLIAIDELKSNIVPFTIKRENSYHDTLPGEEFASATAIRNMIFNNENHEKYAPLCDAPTHSIKNIESLILGYLRISTAEAFKNITGIEDGLDLRIIECAKKSGTLEQFYKNLSTKRYTDHRLRRAVLSCIMGINKSYTMDYIRPLAFNRNGAKILSDLKKNCPLTIISKTADFKPSKDSMFNLDIKATDIASLCSEDESGRFAGKDYTKSPIFIEN